MNEQLIDNFVLVKTFIIIVSINIIASCLTFINLPIIDGYLSVIAHVTAIIVGITGLVINYPKIKNLISKRKKKK